MSGSMSDSWPYPWVRLIHRTCDALIQDLVLFDHVVDELRALFVEDKDFPLDVF